MLLGGSHLAGEQLVTRASSDCAAGDTTAISTTVEVVRGHVGLGCGLPIQVKGARATERAPVVLRVHVHAPCVLSWHLS